MADMTDLLAEVERVAKLCEKATPGPWRHFYEGGGDTVITSEKAEDFARFYIHSSFDPREHEDGLEDNPVAVCALRNLFHSHGAQIEADLGELAAAKEELAEARHVIEWLINWCDDGLRTGKQHDKIEDAARDFLTKHGGGR